MGIPFENDNGSVSVEVTLTEPVKPFQYKVPADISSASFYGSSRLSARLPRNSYQCGN